MSIIYLKTKHSMWIVTVVAEYNTMIALYSLKTFLLMWVKTQTRIYPLGTTVTLLLFAREISLSQCFFLLLLHMKLNPMYLKWTKRNPLVPISIPVPLFKIVETHLAPLILAELRWAKGPPSGAS